MSFYDVIFIAIWVLKILCANKQAFINIFERLLHIVITGKGRSDSDIWLETPNQGTSIKDMILTIWYKEVMKKTKINSQQHHLLSLSVKKACYASYISSYLKNSYTYLVTDTSFYHRLPSLYDGKNLGPYWHSLLVTK